MAHPKLYGFDVCECIMSSYKLVERRLRDAGLIQTDLSGILEQGCYSTNVKASGLTHSQGGVVDFADFTPYRDDFDSLMTDLGWCGAHRTKAQGFTSSHWHIILNGCPHLHSSAKTQLNAFIAGRDGLLDNAKDSGPRPTNTWQEALEEYNISASGTHKDPIMEETMLATASDIIVWYGSVGNRTPDADEVYDWWKIGAGIDPVGPEKKIQDLHAQFMSSSEMREKAVIEAFAKFLTKNGSPVRVPSQNEINAWMATSERADEIHRNVRNSNEAVVVADFNSKHPKV